MIKVKFPIFPVAVSGILFAVFFIISPLIPINFNSYVVVRNFIEFWAAVLIIILLLMAVYAFCCDRTLRYGLVSVFLAGAVLSQIFHIFSCPGMPDFITPNSMNKGYWFFLLSKFLLGAAFLVFAAGQSMQIKDIFCRFYLILLGLGEAAALLFILLRHRALPAVFSGFEVRLSLYRIILEAAALLLFLAAAYFLFTDISFKGNHSQNPNGKTAYILKGVIFYVLAYAFAFLIKLPAEIYFLLNHAFSAAALFFMFLGILSVSNIKNYFIGNTRSKQFLKQVENLSALGYITAGTVHEIRNSLTSVRGFLQVIKKKLEKGQDLKESDLKMYASLMLSEVDRTHSLLNELLFISKPQPQSDLKTCNLGSIVMEVLPIIKNHSILKEVELEVSISKAPMLVQINPQQVKQVILNLTSNAFEAMDNCSKKTLSIKCFPLPCGSKIRLEISDTGKGIPCHLQEKIFEPFFSTKEEKKGTGLGLYVVKNIVEELNGKIWVKSETGVGTSFFIELTGIMAHSNVKNMSSRADIITAS